MTRSTALKEVKAKLVSLHSAKSILHNHQVFRISVRNSGCPFTRDNQKSTVKSQFWNLYILSNQRQQIISKYRSNSSLSDFSHFTHWLLLVTNSCFKLWQIVDNQTLERTTRNCNLVVCGTTSSFFLIRTLFRMSQQCQILVHVNICGLEYTFPKIMHYMDLKFDFFITWALLFKLHRIYQISPPSPTFLDPPDISSALRLSLCCLETRRPCRHELEKHRVKIGGCYTLKEAEEVQKKEIKIGGGWRCS